MATTSHHMCWAYKAIRFLILGEGCGDVRTAQ